MNGFLAALLWATALLSAAVAAGPVDDLLSPAQRAWLATHPKLTVGFPSSQPPAVVEEIDGSPAGVFIDFLDLLNRRLGTSIRVELDTWPRLVERAERREIDMLGLTFPLATHREHFVFTAPFFETYYYIYARSDLADPPRDLASLSGKRVGYVAATRMVEEMLAARGDIELVALPRPLAAKASLSAEERTWLASQPSVRVGIDPAWAPVSFVDERDAPQGIAVAYLRRVEDDIPPSLLLDQKRVRQILVNLLGNAVKFTEAGRIDLRAGIASDGAGGQRLRLSVEDTGPGIPADQQQRIFETFAQGPELAASDGVGLGLTISRRLAVALGGEIRLCSEPGRGSTFVLELPGLTPLPAGQSTTAFETQGPLSTPRLGPARVLIVDDRADNRALLAAADRFDLAELTQRLDALQRSSRMASSDNGQPSRRAESA